MKHLEDRLKEEGISETSIQEILQYVREIIKEVESEVWQEGYGEGVSDTIVFGLQFVIILRSNLYQENIMFTKKVYEYCNIYYNPYEDIEVLQGTVDFMGVDVYISGQHVFECLTLEGAVNYLHDVGVEFKVK